MTNPSLPTASLAGVLLSALALNSAPGLASPVAIVPSGAATAVMTDAVPAMITAADPQSIMAALKAKGWKPELNTSDHDVRSIEFTVDGIATTIRFFNCDDDGAACSTLNFYVGFSGTDYHSFEGINNYNAKRRFGRAYLDDDGDPCLEMDVDLDFDGIPNRNFLEYLNTWNLLIHDFRSRVVG